MTLMFCLGINNLFNIHNWNTNFNHLWEMLYSISWSHGVLLQQINWNSNFNCVVIGGNKPIGTIIFEYSILSIRLNTDLFVVILSKASATKSLKSKVLWILYIFFYSFQSFSLILRNLRLKGFWRLKAASCIIDFTFK